ncbi:MAG: hypothetical protein MZU79_04865 [Anaerotruncus sp.]|nr:hypothetical protein [Anaerotruncus sp.]
MKGPPLDSLPRILALLKKHPEGLDLDRIQAELDVKRKDRAKLLEAVRKLEARGDVRSLRGRFRLAARERPRPRPVRHGPARLRLRRAGGRRRGHLRPRPPRPGRHAGRRGRRRRRREGPVRQARGPRRAHPAGRAGRSSSGSTASASGAPFLQPFDSLSAGRPAAQVARQAPARAGDDRRGRPGHPGR